MNARQAIAQIDQQIDANRAAVLRKAGFMPATAREWQNVRDRFPLFVARDRALYRARGIQQQFRDAEDHRAWQAEQRKERLAQRRAVKASLRQS